MTALARILCVDDEPSLLEALERNLGEHYEIVTATGGHQALDMIAADPAFAVIVSDMRMPRMNGAEFLARARQAAPDASRVLLTGHSETSAAIAAVNDGHIFRFLSKPCPTDVLQRHLDDAIRQHALVTGERKLLADTLNGAIQMMTDLLAIAAPTVFERSRLLRARVKHAAQTLVCDAAWEYEIAALLANIGCLALPAGLVERVWSNAAVSTEERAIYDSHPASAHRLIAAIPRLERVAEIVRLQREARPSGDPVVDQGVSLLRAALELDQLLGRSIPMYEALAVLAKHRHPTAVIDALTVHARECGPALARMCKLADVVVGWVLDRDVTSPGGVLLVKAGTVLSPVLIESLRRFAKTSGVAEPLHVRAS